MSNDDQSVRILYMEDDPATARLFQRRLERAGYTVDLARNGAEGLAMYDQNRHDIVALDQHMPVYEGLDVIRTMAQTGPLPPIIMITGAGDEQVAVEALKLGARDYIVKDTAGGYLDILPTVVEQLLQQQFLFEEKKKAEEALRRSERRYRLLAENSSDLVALLDLEGIIRYASPSHLQILGYPATDLRCQPLLDFIHPDDQKNVQAIWRDVATESEHKKIEARLARQDGGWIIAEIIFSIALNENKQTRYILFAARDITDRKRVEAEREALVAELQEALAQIKTLTGLIPICAACKNIRDDEGYWHKVEVYIGNHSEAEFSHGICPDCQRKLYPELYPDE